MQPLGDAAVALPLPEVKQADAPPLFLAQRFEAAVEGAGIFGFVHVACWMPEQLGLHTQLSTEFDGVAPFPPQLHQAMVAHQRLEPGTEIYHLVVGQLVKEYGEDFRPGILRPLRGSQVAEAPAVDVLGVPLVEGE
jgi:hypothetical protein